MRKIRKTSRSVRPEINMPLPTRIVVASPSFSTISALLTLIPATSSEEIWALSASSNFLFSPAR